MRTVLLGMNSESVSSHNEKTNFDCDCGLWLILLFALARYLAFILMTQSLA